MKTWQAALAHIGLTAIQAAGAVSFFEPNSTVGALANPGIQIGLQIGGALLQGLVAKKNSNTAPDGKPLVQAVDGTYVSTK